MKEIVLITGAHGVIAQELSQRLSNAFEVRLLSRFPEQKNEFKWNIDKHFIDDNALKDISHIVHLAGANVLEKKWTEARRSEIVSSRVKSADMLLRLLQNQNQHIKTFVTASAIGFYGNETSERIFVEDDVKGTGFLSDVVLRWEQAADAFADEGIAQRVVKLRTGIVLSAQGGALPKMGGFVKRYIGAAFGSGKQYMPWIHVDDICAIYEFVLRNTMANGVFNAVAPHQLTNAEFMKVLAEVLKKPLIMPNIPSFVLKSILKESASALLEGTRVSPQKIINAGFEFAYPNLKPALDNLLSEAK
ncbi:MAG: TIGR01777 family oxidoreductase [Bacteroidia bacterium]|nr:TIGR01777 family oxidoreductase [Bacteroidia bacterium]MCO5252750.1 TIGR01777 family oxidoreductase [Bacteroidota bacterium]